MIQLLWMGRIVFAVFCSLTLVLLFVWRPLHLRTVPASLPTAYREPPRKSASPIPISCKGPRGGRLDEKDSQDLPRSLHSLQNVSYPVPTTGSYDEIGLAKTWMSFEQRYGPYGYGEQESSYTFPRVGWETIDWGKLQADCLQDNQHMFGKFNESGGFHDLNRLRHQGHGPDPVSFTSKTGRQAIVLRSWSTYEYKDEDLWNLRSTIAEASLATGSKYTVILLVDVKCESCEGIHTNQTEYQKVLEDSVPAEFRNIAVLFHQTLLERWYKKVGEHKPFWQIIQPLQLLAHFFPEFDHFWQFEMDTRFTGRTGEMLEAFDRFSTKQPYKQSLERASWEYIPEVHGSYQEFSGDVDKAMKGGASIWGPVKVKNVAPIGPQPSSKDPRTDPFEWRVGHEADLLVLGQVSDVRRIESQDDWIFRDWHMGDFGQMFGKLSRYMSVPAQARASWELLEGIHRAQYEHGLAIASEATLPSFAVWLGLKIVAVPLPKHQFPARDTLELNFVKNGNGFGDGIANGPAVSRGKSLAFFVRPMTWDWWSSLCDPVFDRWMGIQGKQGDGDPHRDPVYVQVPDQLPPFMAEVNGTIYMPNLIMHPRKSNNYRSAE